MSFSLSRTSTIKLLGIVPIASGCHSPRQTIPCSLAWFGKHPCLCLPPPLCVTKGLLGGIWSRRMTTNDQRHAHAQIQNWVCVVLWAIGLSKLMNRAPRLSGLQVRFVCSHRRVQKIPQAQRCCACRGKYCRFTGQCSARRAQKVQRVTQSSSLPEQNSRGMIYDAGRRFVPRG